jgi:Conserved TM helix
MINNFLESISSSMSQASLPDLPVLVMQTAATSPVSVEGLLGSLSKSLPVLLGALASLVIGWLVALVASWLVGSLLAKTDIDNRLLRSITGSNTIGGWSAEKIGATITFWIIFLFGVISFLNALNLTAASAPLQTMLSQILGFLPRLLVAALLAVVAWVVATLIKGLILKASQSFGIDRKLQVGTDGNESPMLPSKTIADLSFWAVLFFFLLPVLDTLGLGSSLAPVQNLSAEIMGAIPNIIKAVIIGVVTWFVAKIVRDIVTNIAAAAGSERLAAQLGLNRSMPNQTLAGIAGTLVYVVILVPGIISALQALNIDAISGPAILMLNQITMMLPRVLTAGALIGLSYFIGRFLAELVTTTLATLGFDNIVQVLGLSNLVNEAAPQQPEIASTTTTKTPSQLAGIVVLVATMLTAAISATSILGIPALTSITESVLYIGSQILIGLVVFGVGLFLANLAYRLINAAGTRQANILAQTARIIIIVLVGAMGLQRMGIAPDIVNLAFGLTLGAMAIAAAIAFGLGGRDVAGEQLRQWLTNYKSDRRP